MLKRRVEALFSGLPSRRVLLRLVVLDAWCGLPELEEFGHGLKGLDIGFDD
jgi:hypothetical protein